MHLSQLQQHHRQAKSLHGHSDDLSLREAAGRIGLQTWQDLMPCILCCSGKSHGLIKLPTPNMVAIFWSYQLKQRDQLWASCLIPRDVKETTQKELRKGQHKPLT